MRINRIDIKNESQRLIRSINSNTCGGLPPLCNWFDEPYSLIYGWGDYPQHVTSQNNSAEEQKEPEHPSYEPFENKAEQETVTEPEAEISAEEDMPEPPKDNPISGTVVRKTTADLIKDADFEEF